VPAAYLPSTVRRDASYKSHKPKNTSDKDYAILPHNPKKDKKDIKDEKDKEDEPPPSESKSDDDLINPILEKYLKKRELYQGIAGEDGADKDEKDKKKPPRPALREGTMSTSPSSLFLPEREFPGYKPDLSGPELAALRARAEARKAAIKASEDRQLVEMNIDPHKKARLRLERKLVIRSVKRHGRLTKAQTLARTERQSVFKSQNLPTSVKKLQKVVNQIAGKTVSEALVQLRFSKKKVARDVIKGLEMAQNEAIASRGMGLGTSISAQRRWEKQRNHTDAGKPHDTLHSVDHAGMQRHSTKEWVKIEMKDGSKKVVRDPSEIYVDQAWVGKGDHWKTPEFRARGAVNMLNHQTTSKSPFFSRS